jgi:hypothetical protein
MNDGEKLLIARRRCGLPAWKLAALADLDPTTYSRIERGDPQLHRHLERSKMNIERTSQWKSL